MAAFKAALIQMRSTVDIDRNVAAVTESVREAACSGAQYVQTPEMTNIVQLDPKALFGAIEPEQGNRALAAMTDLARDFGIWLHIGSFSIKLDSGRAANRAYVIAPTGSIVARYDKIHMFDVDLDGGESYRESKVYRPGDSAITVDLPWGQLGLSICYDLRFPNLYRQMAEAGARFLAVPAAFTAQTGRAHWHVLQRARAVETGCFVLAAAQGGKHEDGRSTFGHSLIVDPWGEVLAELPHDEPGVAIATIDPAAIDKARSRVPSLNNGRRFDLVKEGAERTLRAVS
ncbi:MAG: carbon-nitrogen hydrolase family protein [Pseudomonadota bacterium]